MTEPTKLPPPASYVGVPTLIRARYCADLSEVDVALVGIPFDGGVINRPGARYGPREIRNQSSLIRRMNQATRVAPHEICRVADIGDAWVGYPFDLERALTSIAAFYRRIHSAGVVPVSAGGDHSVTLGILRGLADGHPMGLVHFDAHCDTGDASFGSDHHHGVQFRHAVEESLVDPKRTIHIGVRGGVNDLDMWKFSHDHGMRVMYIEEVYAKGVEKVIQEARRIVGDGPTYISFDIDAIDPAYAPGTGKPEVGGFTTLEAQLMVRGLRGLNLVGADVVEVSPPLDPMGTTALVGATLMFEMLCVVADAVAARKAVGRRTE
jgi:guanidinopropionase